MRKMRVTEQEGCDGRSHRDLHTIEQEGLLAHHDPADGGWLEGRRLTQSTLVRRVQRPDAGQGKRFQRLRHARCS